METQMEEKRELICTEQMRKGYLKVKALEVLLFLTGMELSEYDRPVPAGK